MSDPLNCACPCPSPVVSEVPGTEGDDGDAGADGVSAFTLSAGTAGPFDKGDTGISLTVDDSSMFFVGQAIAIEDVNGTSPGYFTVTALPSSVSLTLTYLDIAANSDAASIGSGKIVSPSGPAYAPGALPTAITDNTGGTPSNTLAATDVVRYVTMSFPILLTSTPMTATGDVVTDFVLPFAGEVVSWQLVTEVVATSGGTADVDIELQLGATPVTGSKITALTQAELAAIGQVKAGGTITANNTFAAAATFSIVCTESATDFTAGKVNAYVTFKVTTANPTLENALASLAEHINDLITALS